MPSRHNGEVWHAATSWRVFFPPLVVSRLYTGTYDTGRGHYLLWRMTLMVRLVGQALEATSKLATASETVRKRRSRRPGRGGVCSCCWGRDTIMLEMMTPPVNCVLKTFVPKSNIPTGSSAVVPVVVVVLEVAVLRGVQIHFLLVMMMSSCSIVISATMRTITSGSAPRSTLPSWSPLMRIQIFTAADKTADRAEIEEE